MFLEDFPEASEIESLQENSHNKPQNAQIQLEGEMHFIKKKIHKKRGWGEGVEALQEHQRCLNKPLLLPQLKVTYSIDLFIALSFVVPL